MRFLVSLLILMSAWHTNARELVHLWQIDGLLTPESVVLDEATGYYYFTNINDNPTEADGNGSVGRYNPATNHLEVEWVTGLSSPKGIDLFNNKLYIGDVGEVVVVDIDLQLVSERFSAPTSVLLNDVTIDRAGRVYISDWLGNAIYRIDGGQLSLWMVSPELNMPNGLDIDQRYLYIGAWGTDLQPDFTTLNSGSLLKVDLKTQVISEINTGVPFMNLDGLTKVRRGWVATDFIAGEFLFFDNKGDVIDSLTLSLGAADFYFDKRRKQVIVPNFFNNTLTAYQLRF